MTDIFRKEYKELCDDQKAYVSTFKEKADDLDKEFYNADFLNPDKTMVDLALQNLQQAMFWAVKAIT